MADFELAETAVGAAAKLLEAEIPVADRLLAEARISPATLLVGPRKTTDFLEAVKYLRRASSGASEAFFARASDGKEYLLKYLGNGQGDGILANEWMAQPVYKYMDIETPDVAIVNISPDFVKSIRAGMRINVRPGLAFGSRRIEGDVLSRIPRGAIKNLVNPSDFHKTLVTDAFVVNEDPVGVLFQKQPEGVKAAIIDHGFTFFGPLNAGADSQQWARAWSPFTYDRGFYDQVERSDLAADIERLQNMPDTVLYERLKTVPPQWLGTHSRLPAAIDRVLQSKDLLPEFIERTIKGAPQIFPLVK